MKLVALEQSAPKISLAMTPTAVARKTKGNGFRS
jgi:hypothetical protein